MSDVDDMLIFPITDIDENENEQKNDSQLDNVKNQLNNKFSNNGFSFKPAMTLRQRRHSKLGPQQDGKLHLDVNLRDPLPYQDTILESESASASPKVRWARAFRKLRRLTDPWAKFHIDDLPTERAVRHRYHALKKTWTTDTVQVKMEKDPFNHGAMRACYRMKKLSCFSRSQNWKHAHNYVAKSYMEKVSRDVYFEDVRLQMDAKLWGEEYNRHNPPKKVDIFQMCVLELKDRPGSPLYHLEHFIEGDYIKYNSNSGFVEEKIRLTPQTFSHFTFERSGHRLIVVDIQGVGDLWTDPQVHTADGVEYGDGNLGTRGMALFFHSHMCNDICRRLGLSTFDLTQKEETALIKQDQVRRSSMTVSRGSEEMCISASPLESDMMAFLARRSVRTISSGSSILSSEASEDDLRRQSLDFSPPSTSPEPMSPGSPLTPSFRPSRVRFISESDDSSNTSTLTTEEERFKFQQAASRGARPSCIAHEINMRQLHSLLTVNDSILGQIHHEMAKYHEVGRFVAGDKDPDMEAAIYHEEQAADLGVKEAMLTMAQIFLGLPHNVLVNCSIQTTEDHVTKGVEYMQRAAEVGDRSAMIYLSEAYETGNGLGPDRTRSYKNAIHWIECALNRMQEDDGGEFDATMDHPAYQLQAKMADMYREGGYGLDKDPSSAGELYNEAAESAMAAMKGRLANKYYMLAEEAYAEVEEE